MIEKEIDGVTYYCFEPSEEAAQKQFELAMMGENAFESMMQAFFAVVVAMERREKEAWTSMYQSLPEIYEKQTDGVQMTYNWVQKGFIVKRKPESE